MQPPLAAAPQLLPDQVHAAPFYDSPGARPADGAEAEEETEPSLRLHDAAGTPQQAQPAAPRAEAGQQPLEGGMAGESANHLPAHGEPASESPPLSLHVRDSDQGGGPALGPAASGQTDDAAAEGHPQSDSESANGVTGQEPAADATAPDDEGPAAAVPPAQPPNDEPRDAQARPQPAPAYPTTAEPLSPELVVLRDRVRLVLRQHAQRKLNTRDHTPWEVMHRIVAYGTSCEILRGGPQGTPVNAIGWLLYGGRCKGQRIVTVEQGRLSALQGVGVQGHPGQLLAIIAQGRAQADYPIVLDGHAFTLADLIESEKLTCRSGTELTFKLIALSWYLESDATWRNAAGEEWSIARLVKEEIEAPILRKAACGGTHRLMGLTYAVREREREGKPIDGQFLRAQKYLADYHENTFKLQNADGSFSTEWFVRRGARPDLDRRVQTTGHILEWLVYSIPESMLRDARVVRAVDYLSGILAAQPDRQWEIGPLGHALHALAIYDERAFAPHDAATFSPGVERPTGARAAMAPHSRRRPAGRP